MRALAALVLVGVVATLTACGGSSQNSRIISVCRSTSGRATGSPVTGSIVALGRSPVLIRLDNRGNLNAGEPILGKTDYPGWLAIKTFFFTPPSFRGGFTVRVKGINGPSSAGIGTQPPGGKFTAHSGPAALTKNGWREWPAFTWVKGPGCYEFAIKAGLLEERVVVAALSG
ncbi:MAG: hypothetical protein ACRDLM_04625 [Gaiellaceae bacterium]